MNHRSLLQATNDRHVMRLMAVALTLLLVALLAAPALADTFEGTSGTDKITGTNSLDKILGKGGADQLFGSEGNDRIFGGFGNDTLVGGDGEDYLDGGPGDDTIYTGSLTDGDKYADEVRCGNGFDTVYLSGKDHANHTETGVDCEVIAHK